MENVSVVIPTYNSDRYLSEALDSVLRQDMDSVEIIVVDDGSTDSTRQLVSSYGQRVKYIYQENAGSGKARNEGIKKSSSEYIAFLDSDDYWDENHLKTMVYKLRTSPDCCLVYCGKKWISSKGLPLAEAPKQVDFPSGWIFKEMFEANYISSSSVVVARRKALIDVGCFSESKTLRNAQDYHLWLRMCARYPVSSIKQYTVNYRRHENNRSSDQPSRQKGMLQALESAILLYKEKKVNNRNDLNGIDIQARMKDFFKHAIFSLYFCGEFKEVVEFSRIAWQKGYWSHALLARFLLSISPSFIRSSVSCLKNFR